MSTELNRSSQSKRSHSSRFWLGTVAITAMVLVGSLASPASAAALHRQMSPGPIDAANPLGGSDTPDRADVLSGVDDPSGIDTPSGTDQAPNEQGSFIVPYMLGGVPATPGAYPATVALVANDGSEMRQFCAGTLIARDVVITAAHCGEQNGYDEDIEGLMVLIGRTNLSQSGGELIPVRTMRIHPDWSGSPLLHNDLALLYLERPTNLVAPVPLAITASEPNWSTNPTAVLQGWGYTSGPNTPASILQQLTVNVLSDANCLAQIGSSYQPGFDLCAGEVGTGICNGDSGGPMYATDRNGNTILAGIISRGHRQCGTTAGVMTRVAAHSNWIVDNTLSSSNITRISGATRWETAAAIARETANLIATQSGGSALTVYLATGSNFPDALAASATAGASNGVVLLTEPNALPSATKAALTQLNVTNLIVVGGEMAIDNTTMAAASSAAGVNATRVFGPDRYATAAALSEQAFPAGATTVYVALGTNFPDAVAAGSPAGSSKAPVLLAEANKLPAATRAELERLAPNNIVVLGGAKAISPEVATELATMASVQRISGETRHETAVALSAANFLPGVNTVYVATSQDFPDALAFGPLGTITNSPVLLVEPNSTPASVLAEIKRLKPNQIVAIGGTKAVSDLVLLQLRNAL
ncbi:MAG: cell wall-binding repeat-containing protein [Acidimicrobiia bacterium]